MDFLNFLKLLGQVRGDFLEVYIVHSLPLLGVELFPMQNYFIANNETKSALLSACSFSTCSSSFIWLVICFVFYSILYEEFVLQITLGIFHNSAGYRMVAILVSPYSMAICITCYFVPCLDIVSFSGGTTTQKQDGGEYGYEQRYSCFHDLLGSWTWEDSKLILGFFK